MNTEEIKVLVLDDQRPCQETAKGIIEKIGTFCAITPDARSICKKTEEGELIELVDSLIRVHNPPIVLTDIQFVDDEMAGFGIASYVLKKYPKVKVIGMTSSAFSYDKEVEESGMRILLDKNDKNFERDLIQALNQCT